MGRGTGIEQELKGGFPQPSVRARGRAPGSRGRIAGAVANATLRDKDPVGLMGEAMKLEKRGPQVERQMQQADDEGARLMEAQAVLAVEYDELNELTEGREPGDPEVAATEQRFLKRLDRWQRGLQDWEQQQRSADQAFGRYMDDGARLLAESERRLKEAVSSGRLSQGDVAGLTPVFAKPSISQRLKDADRRLLERTKEALGLHPQSRGWTEPLREGELPGKVGGGLTGVIDELWKALFDDWPRFKG
jgi:hypothetical protein